MIQFPSGVVPSAEMAGFTPCMGIYVLVVRAEIFAICINYVIHSFHKVTTV